MHATIDRSGREILQAELPAPITPLELDPPRVYIVTVHDELCQLVVDGVVAGYAARRELLDPVCRLLGGTSA